MPNARSDAYWRRGLGVLDYSNYIALNRTLIRILGLNAAVLACELVSQARYWASRGLLNDGWFFSTIGNVSSRCGLSKFQQSEAMKRLKDFSIVDVEYRGLPKKRYVRVHAQRLIDIIDENEACPTSGQETGPLEVKKLDINKDSLSGSNSLSAKEELQVDFSSTYDFQVSSGFAPPTVEEVRAFCAANMLGNVDPEVFVSWHEARGWVVNGSPITNWQAAVRSWHVRDRNRVATERASKPKPQDYSDLNAGWEVADGSD